MIGYLKMYMFMFSIPIAQVIVFLHIEMYHAYVNSFKTYVYPIILTWFI